MLLQRRVCDAIVRRREVGGVRFASFVGVLGGVIVTVAGIDAYRSRCSGHQWRPSHPT